MVIGKCVRYVGLNWLMENFFLWFVFDFNYVVDICFSLVIRLGECGVCLRVMLYFLCVFLLNVVCMVLNFVFDKENFVRFMIVFLFIL